jgi:chaperonin cofactor prefoldin
MKRKGVVFCSLLLSLLLMGAGEKPQEPHQPVSDDRLLLIFGSMLGAAFIGILANGVSQLLSSGANQQILDQVAKSLTPIQNSLNELNRKNNELDKTLQEFKIALVSISKTQDSDRMLFKSELTNMGDRLENRICQLESHNAQQDKMLEKLNELINRRTSNE